MEMRVNQVDGVTMVALAGRLDTAGVNAIETRFTASIVPRSQPAVVDLGEVEFLTSLGVRMLLSTARSLSGRGGRLVVCGAIPAVQEIIEATQLHDIVPVVGSASEAMDLARA